MIVTKIGQLLLIIVVEKTKKRKNEKQKNEKTKEKLENSKEGEPIKINYKNYMSF